MADELDTSTHISHVHRIERAQTTSMDGRVEHERVSDGSTPARSVVRNGNDATMANARTCRKDETHPTAHAFVPAGSCGRGLQRPWESGPDTSCTWTNRQETQRMWTWYIRCLRASMGKSERAGLRPNGERTREGMSESKRKADHKYQIACDRNKAKNTKNKKVMVAEVPSG